MVPLRGSGQLGIIEPTEASGLSCAYGTRPRHIELEHLSSNLVWAHGCAQIIRHINFYPLCSGSICLGRALE